MLMSSISTSAPLPMGSRPSTPSALFATDVPACPYALWHSCPFSLARLEGFGAGAAPERPVPLPSVSGAGVQGHPGILTPCQVAPRLPNCLG